MAAPLNYCFANLQYICMTQGEWAAWAQAIMSALAIVVSGFLASSQIRNAKRERVRVFIGMLDIACQCSTRALSVAEHSQANDAIFNNGREGFDRTAATLREIPFHEFPDHALLHIIRDAAACCDTLSIHYDQVITDRRSFNIVELATVLHCNVRLIELHAAAKAVNSRVGLLRGALTRMTQRPRAWILGIFR